MNKKQKNFLKELKNTDFIEEIFNKISLNEGKNILDKILLILKEKEEREEKEAIKKEKIKCIIQQLNTEGFTIKDLKKNKNKHT